MADFKQESYQRSGRSWKGSRRQSSCCQIQVCEQPGEEPRIFIGLVLVMVIKREKITRLNGRRYMLLETDDGVLCLYEER